MLADFFSDIDKNDTAASIRIIGLFIFLVVLFADFILNFLFGEDIMIPVFLTEDDKKTSRNMFQIFINSNKKLNSGYKLLEKTSMIKMEDLILRLDNNPRDSDDPDDWPSGWRELITKWENNIDKELRVNPFFNHGYCYHISPRVPLVICFALGATVKLERPLILYHKDKANRFHSVINLTNPREVIYEPKNPVVFPVTNPENFGDLKGGNKLILNLIISPSHPENFKFPDEGQNASYASIVYACDLHPNEDWLPYVQNIYRTALQVIDRYDNVEIRMRCPDVIAFALGMAFSRRGHIDLSNHRGGGKYISVFSLSEIERKMYFG